MINSSSQKIFNNSLLYTIGTVASKAVAFFLIPIYTYNLTAEEYGMANVITTFVSTFGIVMMLSLRAAIMRFFNDYEGMERRKFIGTITLTVLTNSFTLCAALCLLRGLYTDVLFKGIPFFPYVFLGIISLGTEGVYLIYQSVLQAEQSGGRYSLNSFVYLTFNAITTILFVVVFKMHVLGVVLANLITNAGFAAYGLFEMIRRKYLKFSFDKVMFVKSIKYSLPILPHNLANDVNIYANKVIISNLLSNAMTGIYSLASQFASMVNLVQTSINLAFRPWFVEQMGKGNEGRAQIKYMTEMIMALFCFIAVCVCVFSREIVLIMADKQYLEAWKIIPLFVFVQLVTFIYYTHVQTLMYNLRISKFTFVCSISGLITNIILSVLLAKPLGVYGIALAQLAAKTVLSAIAVVMSNYAEKVDFGLKRMIVYLLAAVAFAGVSVALSMCIGVYFNAFVSILLRLLVIAGAFAVYIWRYLEDFKTLIFGILRRKGHKNG